MNMTEETITIKALCSQCKNYQYIDRFLRLCDLGRVKEFNEDGSITECPYWEAKKG